MGGALPVHITMSFYAAVVYYCYCFTNLWKGCLYCCYGVSPFLICFLYDCYVVCDEYYAYYDA